MSSTTNGVTKAAWGKVKKSGVTPSPESSGVAPKTMPKLEDIDIDKLVFQVPIKRTNDWCSIILYDGEPFQFAFSKLPMYSRMPFAPGLPTKDGLAIGTQMSTRIDLTPAQYDKWLAIEAHFCNTMVEHRTMVFPHDKKKGETACSKEVFLSKMKRKAIPADPEKGYSASLQVRVNHEEGKQPKVLLTKMIEEGPHAGKNTQPKQGCFEDLTAKCAGAFQARVRGGAYYGNFGMGLPVTLEAACIVVNKQGTGGPTIDFSETEFVPESEVPGLKDEPVAKDDEGSADEEPYTTEQFDRDIARA